MTPDPTATGDIALTVVAPIVNEEPQDPVGLAFTTSNLVLSQEGGFSASVQMDVVGTEMRDSGPETYTGTFTIDGVEHDFAILTEIYDIS